MSLVIFVLFGLILYGITNFVVEKLDSRTKILFTVLKGVLFLLIAPIWILYSLIALDSVINSTDKIDEVLFNKKSVYFKYCSDFEHDAYSCPDDKLILTRKVNFKVSFENQIVVEDSGTTLKHTNCSVYDVNNWNCENEEKTFNVQDGSYFEYYPNKDIHQTIDENGEPSVLPIYLKIDKSEYVVRDFIAFFRHF